ncbi:MAG: putative transcriptional regulator [Pseudoalteromonas tetraodonis]|jgi:putative transcriptional regulator
MTSVEDQPVQEVVTEIIQAVKQAREENGISRYRLAKLTGLHASTISLIERGERSPSLFVMLKISAALEISLGCILSKNESQCRCEDEPVASNEDSVQD